MPNQLPSPPSAQAVAPDHSVAVSDKQDACLPVLAVVAWHRQAPDKPALGAPCNGCGLCCLAAPCPLGMWVSRRRTGACKALLWSEENCRYQCGLLADPARITGWRRPWLLRWCRSWVKRWIAAGVGCDADIVWQPAASACKDESIAPHGGRV